MLWATSCFANQCIRLSVPIKAFLVSWYGQRKLALFLHPFVMAASSCSASLCILESLWHCITSLLRSLSIHVPTLLHCIARWRPHFSENRFKKWSTKTTLPTTEWQRQRPCQQKMIPEKGNPSERTLKRQKYRQNWHVHKLNQNTVNYQDWKQNIEQSDQTTH